MSERPVDHTVDGRFPDEACPRNGGFVHSRVRYEYDTKRPHRTEGFARVAVCADCGARNDGSGMGWKR